jgi:hypothetical protein
MYFTSKFLNKMFRLGLLLTLVLILLDILTYLYYPDTVMGSIFLATREQTPMTWVSALVLLFIGLSCATVYMRTKSRVWYFLSLAFLFFSMDDATYFHERFSGALQEIVPFMASFPSYSWIIVYLPLLVLSIGTLVYKIYKSSLLSTEKKMLFLGLALLAISLFLDMVDGYVGRDSTLVFCLDPGCSKLVEHFARLTEETFEVIGFGMLAYLNIKLFALEDKVAG